MSARWEALSANGKRYSVNVVHISLFSFDMKVTTRTPIKAMQQLTRTIQVSDAATFRQSPSAEPTKEGLALYSLELEKEEPEFIDIQKLIVASDPKVLEIFKDSIASSLACMICPAAL